MISAVNPKNCSRWDSCSTNCCPADLDASLRKNLPGESRCAYSLNKKNKTQKGIKTLMPIPLLKLIPESNLKLLNNRNQKRRRASN
jgi:hypothetical protein